MAQGLGGLLDRLGILGIIRRQDRGLASVVSRLEIDVTPDMVRAGANALVEATISDLAAGDITPDEVSVLVYRAMERVRLQACDSVVSGVEYPEAPEFRIQVLVPSGFGHQKGLWGLGCLERNPSHSDEIAVSPGELFGLAVSCLLMASQATLERAKAYLRARWYPR